MQSAVKFTAQVEPAGDLVRSPVTDQPCVYWRLRVVERAVALTQSPTVQSEDLPTGVRERRATSEDDLGAAVARGLTLAEVEREYIKRVLAAEGGNKTRAAQRLGLDRKTLYRKLEEYAAGGTPPDDDEGGSSR